MTKEEIQAEAEEYIKLRELLWPDLMNMPLIKNELISLMKGVFVDGVESDTARKHWEQKWIPVSERLPEKKDADENGKVLVKREVNPDQKLNEKCITDWGVVKYCDKQTTYWTTLPTFND